MVWRSIKCLQVWKNSIAEKVLGNIGEDNIKYCDKPVIFWNFCHITYNETSDILALITTFSPRELNVYYLN
jgi:hypothetical protein